MNMIVRKIPFGDIRFWILVLFCVRLYGITLPPLEVSHNWRQTTVTMVSRNFLECDHSVFYPRIDIAGEKSGITGMEFPLLNYIIYLLSEVFGYSHWYGRLVNLVVSSFGLWYFYLLIRKYFSERHAFFSAILLGVSVWFQFSRKIMPDTFSVSLLIMGLYYGSNYLESNGRLLLSWKLLFYFAFLVSGALSKITSLPVMAVLVLFFLNGKIPLSRKVVVGIVSLAGLIPVSLWYFYWVPHLVDTFGFWHFFMGKGIFLGMSEIAANLPQTLSRFYDTAMKFSGFAVFVTGLVFALLNRERRVLRVFFVVLLFFVVVIFKAGFTFPHHSYYIVPFVPVMAFVAGYGLASIGKRRLATALLLIVAAEGIANQYHDFRIKENVKFMVSLEQDLDKVSGKHDLFLINSGEFPTPMYFAHRKGWVDYNEKVADRAYVDSLKRKGLKYILVLKRSFGTEVTLSEYQKVADNDDYCLYKL